MKKRSTERRFEQVRNRILPREKSAIQVKTESQISIALAFPNSYPVGMANLGFQSVFRIFNESPIVRCERAFFDKSFPVRTKTLESGTDLRFFDCVAFSISFELDIPNLVQSLIEAKIEPLAENRDPREPIIIVGGPVCFINPAPLSVFADVIVIGELEPIASVLIELLGKYKNREISRNELFEQLSHLEGIYLPNFTDKDTKVKKIHANFHEQNPQHSVILSPDSHFQNMFLIEIGRGCGRRCRFCAASHIYHPYRFFPVKKIIETIERNIHDARRVGLVGAALSDYPYLFDLCKSLIEKNLELGLSSFRLDMITPEFLEIFKKAKINSIAFAPEAGSERMRGIINKNLTTEAIISAAHYLAESEISQIKLYFLIGLPGEKKEDIDAIVQLVKELNHIFMKSTRQRKLILSVNTFIPKPWTPFQWAPIAKAEEISEKRKYISRNLKNLQNVEIIKKSQKEEILQAALSLGDEKIGKAVLLKLKEKITWDFAMKQSGVDLAELIFEPRNRDMVFPWDFILTGLRKEFLWKNWSSVKERL